MPFNPPPNWPKPPEGWVPPAGWTPDPSWPPPPPGWELWTDEDAAGEDDAPSAAAHRAPLGIRDTGDGGEYFGGEQAWSDDAPEHEVAPEPVDLIPSGSEDGGRTALAFDNLSAAHIGLRAEIRWEDAKRFELGTIASISSSSTALQVHFAGREQPAGIFVREGARLPNPTLFVWL